MTDELKVGDKYWTIMPSDESKSNGDGSLRRPWHGVVAKVCPYGDVQLSSYSEKGVPDDPNASSLVPKHLLFKKEKDAWDSYRSYLRDQSDGILREILFVDDKLGSL
jgi:hypothetical protein